jgi:hypothetical protein
MTKSPLVKIGVPPEQAQGIRGLRRIRQILEQHDAAVARLTAATNERIREAANTGEDNVSDADVDRTSASEAQPVS